MSTIDVCVCVCACVCVHVCVCVCEREREISQESSLFCVLLGLITEFLLGLVIKFRCLSS